MATEYVIIKIRGGLETDFYPAMLLPREMYISTDKGWMYYCYSAGNVKRFTTIEDIKNEITGATQEIIDEITEAVEQATIYATEQGDYALEQGNYAKTQGDYAYQKGQEAQAIVDSAAPIINTNLQATYADKATQTGEFLHVGVADDALVEITKIEGNTLVEPANPSEDISPDNVATITSAKDFDVVTCGKNLAKSVYYNTSGQYNTSVYAIANLKPNTKYVISLVVPSGKSYYSNERLFNQLNIVGNGTRKYVTVTTKDGIGKDHSGQMDANGRWVIFKNAGGFSSDNSEQYLQIELGEVATDYEPYIEDRITITKELNKLENGVADTRERIDDKYVKYIQRIERVVFDGSEDESWVLEVTNDNTLLFRTSLFLSNASNDNNKAKLLCDKLNQANIYASDIESIGYTGSSNFLRIRISKTRFATQDVDGFKTWLQANPVTVLYEPETPIETIVEEPSMLTSYKGVTNIFTTAEVQPKLTGTFKSELWANEYKINEKIDTTVGTLENLDTANKDNLVGAINETNEIAVNASHNVSEQFDPDITYAVGDYMIRNNTLFRCKNPITAPKPFDFSDWEATTVGKEMTTANDNLAKIGETQTAIASSAFSLTANTSANIIPLTLQAGTYILSASINSPYITECSIFQGATAIKSANRNNISTFIIITSATNFYFYVTPNQNITVTVSPRYCWFEAVRIK